MSARSCRPVARLRVAIFLGALAAVGTGSVLLGWRGHRYAFAPGGGPSGPDRPQSVHYGGTPERIVSLAPSNTELLFALGLGERVVGVTDVCDYPPEARLKPKVGALLNVDLEKVIACQPDLVVASEGQSGCVDALRAAGVRCIVVTPRSVREVLDSVIAVADACGRHAEGRRLRDSLEHRLRQVAAGVDACVRVEGRTRTFVMIDAGSLWTAGEGTFLDELVRLAGGDNVAADAGRGWVELSEEVVLDRDPQVIVAICPGWEQRVAARAWAGVTAVRTDRCVAVDPDLVSRPGPRIVEGLAALGRALHPGSFAAPGAASTPGPGSGQPVAKSERR